MKTRLSKKIINTTSVFGNWDSNYQPYSVSQQQKALKTMKIPMSVRNTILEYGVYRKLPKEYRKHNGMISCHLEVKVELDLKI